jgi:proteasome accessory factor C
MVTSAERLRRLLALVPYVVARRAVGLAETAATFGMTERELIDDLNLAWCVELKSPEPYCPIDLSYEDGLVTISQAESIARCGWRPTRRARSWSRCGCWPRRAATATP